MIVLAVLILVLIIRPTGLTSEERSEDLAVTPPEEVVAHRSRVRPSRTLGFPTGILWGIAAASPELTWPVCTSTSC